MSVAEFLAQLLEPAERDAVLGDIAESGGSAWDVLGLVLRRRAIVWASLIPVALTLTFLAVWFERGWELRFFVLRNYSELDPAILTELSLTKRDVLVQSAARAWPPALAAILSGFVLARHSRFLLGTSIAALLFWSFKGLPPWFHSLLSPVILQIALVWIPLLIGMRLRRKTT